MSIQYHYLNDSGQSVGPFSLEQLVEMDRHGLIGNAQIRADGDQNWKPLPSVLEAGAAPPQLSSAMIDAPVSSHLPRSQSNKEEPLGGDQSPETPLSSQSPSESTWAASKKNIGVALDFGFNICEFVYAFLKKGVAVVIVILIVCWVFAVFNPDTFYDDSPRQGGLRRIGEEARVMTEDEMRSQASRSRDKLFRNGVAFFVLVAAVLWGKRKR